MIPVCIPNLGKEEQEYARRAISSGHVGPGGEFTDLFEDQLCKLTGASWAIATVTGTAALHAALVGSGAWRNSPLRVRAMTFIATANAVRLSGARCTFYDIHDEWFDIDSSLIGSSSTPQIIDTCPGLQYLIYSDTKRYKAIECVSFSANKIITTGHGGAVLGFKGTSREEIFEFCNVGKRSASSERYCHSVVAQNYRMSNLSAAIGVAQLEKIHTFMDAKKKILDRYRSAGIRIMNSEWMAVAWVRDRYATIEVLRQLGIIACTFWKPLYRQEPYKRGMDPNKFPNSEALWKHLICIPCSTNLSDEDQSRVISAMRGQ